MTNIEFFFKAFPCLKQDEEWPNLLWWIDEKGKRQLLGDIYDSNFWDAEYKEPTTKNDSAHNLCDSCTNIRCEFQSGIVRTKCAFYTPPQLKSDISIGEAIKDYEEMKKGWYLINPDPLFDFTIDILQKYQKIEDIYYHQSGRALEDSLRAVIEGGEVEK